MAFQASELIDEFDTFVGCVSEQLGMLAASAEEVETLKDEISLIRYAQNDMAARLLMKDEEIANLTAHVSSLVAASKSNICKQTSELTAQKALQKLQYEVSSLCNRCYI
jgi:hypothetical protein